MLRSAPQSQRQCHRTLERIPLESEKYCLPAQSSTNHLPNRFPVKSVAESDESEVLPRRFIGFTRRFPSYLGFPWLASGRPSLCVIGAWLSRIGVWSAQVPHSFEAWTDSRLGERRLAEPSLNSAVDPRSVRRCISYGKPLPVNLLIVREHNDVVSSRVLDQYRGNGHRDAVPRKPFSPQCP
jgi:hypothetical protein